MIPEGVDVFGRRALVTAAPYLTDNGEMRLVREDGIEIGAEVAIVDEDEENLRVVGRGALGRSASVHRDCLTIVSPQATPPAPIGPEVAAHVLWHYRQLGYPPGSFTSELIRAIAGADPGNRRLLARAFPDYVRAVSIAADDPGGIDRLRQVMQTRKPLT